MTPALDLSAFVQRRDEGAAHIEFAVEGIIDATSLHAIETALRKLPGITRARVNFTDRRLLVEWMDQAFDPARIINDLAALGYRIHPFRSNAGEDTEAAQARWLLRCLAVAAFAAMNVMLLSIAVWAGNISDMRPETRDFFHWLSALIVLPATGFAGQPFFRSAIRAIRSGTLNMDVPISLGILLALSMSVAETVRHAEHAYFDSAIMLLVFLLAGRYLDHAMRRKTRTFAANLSALRAPTASRIEPNGEMTAVPLAALAAGDLVLVGAGERIPVDGIVVSGCSEVDQSLVTGESSCCVVSAGSEVYAGALNFSGALRIRARAVAGGTLLDEIERLIEGAATQKGRYLRLADRAAQLYAPLVHATAILTAIGWLLAGASTHDAIVIAITVLIITCPCALALAVPAVQVVAAGALFRSKVLLNAGDAIERLADIDTVVFDKTGTLTLPESQIANADDVAPHLVECAARLALSSHHPLALALATLATNRSPFEDCQEASGEGVRAMIDGIETRLGSTAFCDLEGDADGAADPNQETSVIAFRHGTSFALFRVHQKLRSDALPVVEALRSRGLSITILSGDRVAAVKACAEALGITRWGTQFTPADKVAFLAELKAQGRKVLMVGDGINDAPALAGAFASLAPIAASGITQATADALFLGDRLAPVLAAVDIARRAKSLMRQNLWFAVLYNSIAVPLAMSGLATPLIAAAAMSGSSVAVTLNALRARGAGSVWKASSLEPIFDSRSSPRLNEALP
ncbi:MAG TPA: heavy metal translocating P-type ATPase [Methylocella sp.]|nr:heavy metal translocating P-type ATPase [Methylocella sp.]